MFLISCTQLEYLKTKTHFNWNEIFISLYYTFLLESAPFIHTICKDGRKLKQLFSKCLSFPFPSLIICNEMYFFMLYSNYMYQLTCLVSNLSNTSHSPMLGMLREPRNIGKNNGIFSNFCSSRSVSSWVVPSFTTTMSCFGLSFWPWSLCKWALVLLVNLGDERGVSETCNTKFSLATLNCFRKLQFTVTIDLHFWKRTTENITVVYSYLWLLFTE